MPETLPAHCTRTLQELYCCKTILRQYLDHSLTTPWPLPDNYPTGCLLNPLTRQPAFPLSPISTLSPFQLLVNLLTCQLFNLPFLVNPSTR